MSYHSNNASQARPIVRHIVRTQIQPAPSQERADEYAERLKSDWATCSHDYLALVNHLADTDDCQFDDGESEVWIRPEGIYASTVTFPRVRGKFQRAIPFDIRICTALCSKSASVAGNRHSSKNIARVGVPYSPDHDLKWLDGTSEQLANFVRVANHVASGSAKWGHSQLERVVLEANSADTLSIAEHEHIEISAYGSLDPQIGIAIEELDSQDLQDQLRDRERSSLLSNCFGQIADVGPKGISEHLDPHLGHTWFVVPTPIETREGYTESRDMLYWMRPVSAERIALAGIGYDDSRSGDLAQQSSLKLARWLGARI